MPEKMAGAKDSSAFHSRRNVAGVRVSYPLVLVAPVSVGVAVRKPLTEILAIGFPIPVTRIVIVSRVLIGTLVAILEPLTSVAVLAAFADTGIVARVKRRLARLTIAVTAVVPVATIATPITVVALVAAPLIVVSLVTSPSFYFLLTPPVVVALVTTPLVIVAIAVAAVARLIVVVVAVAMLLTVVLVPGDHRGHRGR